MGRKNNNYFSKKFSKRGKGNARKGNSRNRRQKFTVNRKIETKERTFGKQLKSTTPEEDSAEESERINPAMYETVSAPLINRWTRDAIRTFKERRKIYKDQMRQIEGGEERILPLRLCLGNSIRETFCQLIVGKSFEEITDEDVIDAMEGFLDVQPKGNLETLHENAIKRELRMKYDLLPDERVFKFFEDHRRILRKEGLERFAESHPKKVIKQLTKLLRPQALQDVVMGILLESNDAKGDYKQFFKVVTEQMILIAPFFGQKRRNEYDENDGYLNKRDSYNNKRNKDDRNGTKEMENKKSENENHKPKNPNQTGGAQQKIVCYYCGEPGHTSPVCPVKQNGGKKTFFQKAKVALLSNIDLNKPAFTTASQSLNGFLGMQIPVKFCLDTGASLSIISTNHMDEVTEKLKIYPYKTKENITLMMVDEDHKVKIYKKCRLDIKILTTKGELICRNVNFIIAQLNMSEVILGNPFLKSLGIDVCHELALLSEKQSEHFLKTIKQEGQMEVEANFDFYDTKEFEPTRVGEIPKDHPDFGDDLPDPIEDALGGNDPVELRKALKEIVNTAKDNGASLYFQSEIERLLTTYEEVWRLLLGSDAPVKVKPMRVELKKGMEPYKTTSRRYSPIAQDFMKLETDRQIRWGFAYLNKESQWASAPFCVRKKVKEDAKLPPLIDLMRMTVDLREVNQRTTTTIWPMPNLEVMLGRIAGAKYFALFDLTSGYWQFPLAKECQEIFSYMTDKGVYTPTRVPQGAAGSVAYVQAAMCEILGEELLYIHAAPWIDDVLVWANTEKELITWIESLLKRCKSYGLKLHARKSQVFTLTAIWCGRVISEKGVSHDPARLETLKAINLPTNGADLQQFLCAVTWLQLTLPNYSQTINPLQVFMEKVYQVAKGRSKRKVKRIKLNELGWGAQQDSAWNDVKQMLAHSMTMAHPDPEKMTCVFTDASEDFWGAIVTQIPKEDVAKPIDEQAHELLAFVSHCFKGSQLRWAIIEKEAYAIVATCVRLDYLLLRQGGFYLFTDHRNLQFIFGNSPKRTCLHKHTEAKLQRWSLLLMAFEYRIQFIDGEKNVWADLLSRWGAADFKTRKEELTTTKVNRVLMMPINPTIDKDFVWPTLKDIQNAQIKYANEEKQVTLARGSDNIWRTASQLIWIPNGDRNLQIRLLIISHCGSAGHRAYDATCNVLKQVVWWSTMDEDLRNFMNDCLHCLKTCGPHKVPRPYGEAIHSDHPNEVLHMDWLYILGVNKGQNDTPQYIHVLLDDASRYLQLTIAPQPTAAATVEALLDWSARFGIPKVWVSDGGAHYINETIKELSERTGTVHHITVAYSPWANGTVESMMSQILHVLRALIAEWRMDMKHWPLLVPIVQGALNQAPSARLGGRAPMEVFTGLNPTRPLDSLIHPKTKEVKMLKEVNESLLKEIKLLALKRNELHKTTSKIANKLRAQARARHNKKGKVKYPNFIEGDFVLVGLINKSRQKLRVCWLGPRRITKVLSEWEFEVEDLITKKKERIHASRLKFFSEKSLEITEDLKNQIAHDEETFEIEKIEDIRYLKEYNRYEIYIKWRGFSEDENTWEFLEEIWETTKDVVKKFLTGKDGKQTLKKEAVKWLKENKMF